MFEKKQDLNVNQPCEELEEEYSRKGGKTVQNLSQRRWKDCDHWMHVARSGGELCQASIHMDF